MKPPRRSAPLLVTFLIVAAVLAWISAGGWTGIRHSAFAQALKAEIEPPRASWEMPDKVIEALRIHRGETIADIGSGKGYFAVRLARAVAPNGLVYAVDIDQAALDSLSELARPDRLPIITHLAKPDDPGLAPDSVQLVFICDAYHHIRSPEYLRKLSPALTRGGRVAIIDFKKDRRIDAEERYAGRISREHVISDFKRAGYTVEKEYEFLPKQYFIVFAPGPIGEDAK